MPGQLDHAQRTGDVEPSPAAHFRDQWMSRVLCSKDVAGLFELIPLINFYYGHNCEGAGFLPPWLGDQSVSYPRVELDLLEGLRVQSKPDQPRAFDLWLSAVIW